MDSLTEDERAFWHTWKVAAETVRTRVAADITSATGLSDPDFGVLIRVAEQVAGRMRQNLLAAAMGYQRSRLSHHLTRMQDRGLITRERAGGGIDVVITDAGRAEAVARPVHAAAVHRHLLDPLDGGERTLLAAALTRLAGRARPASSRPAGRGRLGRRIRRRARSR